MGGGGGVGWIWGKLGGIGVRWVLEGGWLDFGWVLEGGWLGVGWALEDGEGGFEKGGGGEIGILKEYILRGWVEKWVGSDKLLGLKGEKIGGGGFWKA